MITPVLHTARSRRRALERLAETTVDVLVVGGGITGAGVALDAASRGLSVALVEAHDLAYGTSRFSSKLVHGGLRYLATGDVATARESAHERHLLMTRIAPHLIRPLPLLIPFSHGVSAAQRAGAAAGMALGDVLRMRAGTSRATLPAPRLVGARTVSHLTPAVDGRRLRGGVLGTDGQLVDDARLVVAVARTAAGLGADVLTRVRAERLRGDGATVVDTLSGERFDLRARGVVNAAGVWSGTLDDAIRVRPSRGTHVLVDAATLGHPTAALMTPHPGSVSRFVFALPVQLGRVLIGLTDEDAPGDVPEVADPTEHEIRFLLSTVDRVLRTPLARGDVVGAFAGLRPLVDADPAHGTGTADVSRRHLVAVAGDGHVTVLGGKLTTYRRMAEDAVDRVCAERGLTAARSGTATLPLVGAAGDRRGVASLVARYGGEASHVLAGARCEDPAEQVAPGIDVTRAEVEFAVRSEGALTADDVLDRRTRIGLVPHDRTRAAAAVAELVAAAASEP